MVFVRFAGEIQAKDIGPLLEQSLEHRTLAAGRSDGGNDLCIPVTGMLVALLPPAPVKGRRVTAGRTFFQAFLALLCREFETKRSNKSRWLLCFIFSHRP